jgi:Ca-activated chloride channel family protein
MQFANPLALWALVVLPFLALFAFGAQVRRRRAMERIGERALISQLVPAEIAAWRAKRLYAGIAVFALLAIAAARPQYGQIEQTIKRAGVDVIVAIDTSRSMLAADVEPNRLEKAKESLGRLVHRLQGNRIGIVAFAGEAFLLCPMTLDTSLASLVLEAVDHTSVGVQGTDLAKAIEVAKGAFERGSAGSPVLVLLTDGEDNEGRGRLAAEEAAKSGMTIYAIGIGTERGAPVPESEDPTKGYKENDDGTKVVSRLNIEGLEAIAKETDGQAYAAGDNPLTAVNSISLRIDRMQKSDLESRKLMIYQDRFGWFVAPAIVLLIWMMITRPDRKKAAKAVLTEGVHASRTA